MAKRKNDCYIFFFFFCGENRAHQLQGRPDSYFTEDPPPTTALGAGLEGHKSRNVGSTELERGSKLKHKGEKYRVTEVEERAGHV